MGLRRGGDLAVLLAEAARGDQDSFMSFYDQTCATVYALARRVTADEAQAEQQVRRAYVRAWSAAEDYPASGLSPIVWLLAGMRFSASVAQD